MLLDCAMAVCLPPNRPQFHIYSYHLLRREKMGQLDGKTPIVTGASRGLGASHARRSLPAGAQGLLTDMRPDCSDRQNGRAESRKSGCQYGIISVVALSFKN